MSGDQLKYWKPQKPFWPSVLANMTRYEDVILHGLSIAIKARMSPSALLNQSNRHFATAHVSKAQLAFQCLPLWVPALAMRLACALRRHAARAWPHKHVAGVRSA